MLMFLGVCGTAVLIYLASKQELGLRQLRNTLASTSLLMKQKEENIYQLKLSIVELNTILEPLNTKVNELHKKKDVTIQATEDLNKSLQGCKEMKAASEKTKANATEILQKQKDEHETEKMKALEQIQGLKQQILDRDKAVCAFVDKTNQEGMKLCGTP